jgi:hypothetical protein
MAKGSDFLITAFETGGGTQDLSAQWTMFKDDRSDYAARGRITEPNVPAEAT